TSSRRLKEDIGRMSGRGGKRTFRRRSVRLQESAAYQQRSPWDATHSVVLFMELAMVPPSRKAAIACAPPTIARMSAYGHCVRLRFPDPNPKHALLCQLEPGQRCDLLRSDVAGLDLSYHGPIRHSC